MNVASAKTVGLQHREVVRNLIAERSRLRQELNSVLSRRFWDLEQADDGYAIDTESWRDDELPALIRRLDAEVSAAEAALDRLRREVFGICIDCGEDIAAVQLRIDPSRARCAQCEHSQANSRTY